MTEKYSKPANIVIFMPDQLRFDSVGTFGNDVVQTPHIDRLASRGVKFNNCYLQHSVCAQSRASIVTGRYPHATGHWGLATHLESWEDNFFKSLKENNYHVVSVGERGHIFKNGASEGSLNEYGFLLDQDINLFESFTQARTVMGKYHDDYVQKKADVDYGRLYYQGERDPVLDFDEAVIQSAEKWFDGIADGSITTGGKPWVLFLPLFFPHCPFAVEEPYFSLHDRSKIPRPLSSKDKTGYEPIYMKELRDRHQLNDLPLEVWQEVGAVYYGMISRLDAQLGRIVSKMEKGGHQKDSLTIFFTDHGEYLGDHDLIEKWPAGVSEQLVHEPLIISGLDLPQGKAVNSLVEMVDLVPTLFDFAQIDTNIYNHNGKSLVPLLYGDESKIKHKEYVLSEGGFLENEYEIIEHAEFPYDIKANLQHEEIVTVGRVTALRNEDYTFIYRLYEKKNELYDRRNDLREQHNLIDNPDYIDVVKNFEKDLLNIMIKSSGIPSFKTDGPHFLRNKVDLPKPGQTKFD